MWLWTAWALPAWAQALPGPGPCRVPTSLPMCWSAGKGEPPRRLLHGVLTGRAPCPLSALGPSGRTCRASLLPSEGALGPALRIRGCHWGGHWAHPKVLSSSPPHTGARVRGERPQAEPPHGGETEARLKCRRADAMRGGGGGRSCGGARRKKGRGRGGGAAGTGQGWAPPNSFPSCWPPQAQARLARESTRRLTWEQTLQT